MKAKIEVDPFGRVCGELWEMLDENNKVTHWEWPCRYADEGYLVPMSCGESMEDCDELWPVWSLDPDGKQLSAVPDYREHLDALLGYARRHLKENDASIEMKPSKNGGWSVCVWKGIDTQLLIGFSVHDYPQSGIVLAIWQALKQIEGAKA